MRSTSWLLGGISLILHTPLRLCQHQNRCTYYQRPRPRPRMMGGPLPRPRMASSKPRTGIMGNSVMTQQGSNAKRASSTANWWLAYIVIQNIASFPLGIIVCEACA